MTVLRRNNVQVRGQGVTPMIFIHGYGCDQNMWRMVAPAFEADYQIVQYDLTGCGQSQLWAYDQREYESLNGHATDLLEICGELGLSQAIVVGHSVSAMTAALAANREPERIAAVVMVAPSPCYLNDGDYRGGFERADIDGLLDFLDSNFLGWSSNMAPAILGVPEQPELAEELTNSFCRTDPEIAKHFGRVTFLSDHRADVRSLEQPTLVMQCSGDIVAPLFVGEWLQRNIAHSDLVIMEAKGHCPHLSAPAETIAAIRRFLTATELP